MRNYGLPSPAADCLRRQIGSRQPAAIAVGFSGGADSTALLHMLLTYAANAHASVSVTAIHVHHGIRGAEADRDAAFCREFCERYGIFFCEYRCDVPALAQKKHLSLEEAAREERYRCFAEFLSGHPEVTFLLTAHHADDQAETVLFRLLRGTAVRGLTGIPEVRDFPVGTRTVRLLRPLLRMRKQELADYCAEHALSYVTDSTNLSDDCTRNLIRNRILPAAEEINPAFSDALLRLAGHAAADEAYFRTQTEPVLAEITDFRQIPMHLLRTLHPALTGRILCSLYEQALRVLRNRDISSCPLGEAHVDAMVALLQRDDPSPGSVSLPARLRFSVFSAGDLCGFSETGRETRAQMSEPKQPIPLLPGIPAVWNGDFVCFADDHSPESAETLSRLKNIYKLFISSPINSDKLNCNLFVRARRCRQDDRYLCGGSTKTVKDALSAHKVPPVLRAELPLFCDAEGILWVPFCGIRDSVNPKRAESPHLLTLYYFYHI